MGMKRSETIEQFLNFINEQIEQYTMNLHSLEEEHKMTQDILHKLELEPLTYKERCRLMTILKKNRINRRKYKDALEEAKPFIDFLGSNEGQKLIKRFNNVLGEMRKIESYHARRMYIPKTNLEEIINSN